MIEQTVHSDPRVGTVLQGRYRILSRLAAGGMGVVYRGERLELGRTVAIKLLHPWVAEDPNFQRRFQLEAQAMSRLSHPCCVSVIDFGVEEGSPFLVMDFITGRTLRMLLREGPLSTGQVLGIMRQVLAGLAHAHAQGIVHRDIKPDNIVVTETTGLGDQVRILDFGLAKLRDSVSSLTAGLAVGTPSYMAPEQILGEEVNACADIYSAGVLLFELLTGAQPFSSEHIRELMRQHREKAPPSLRNTTPERDFSDELEAVVAKALAKQPQERFQSATDFMMALEATPEASGQAMTHAVSPFLVATGSAARADVSTAPTLMVSEPPLQLAQTRVASHSPVTQAPTPVVSPPPAMQAPTLVAPASPAQVAPTPVVLPPPELLGPASTVLPAPASDAPQAPPLSSLPGGETDSAAPEPSAPATGVDTSATQVRPKWLMPVALTAGALLLGGLALMSPGRGKHSAGTTSPEAQASRAQGSRPTSSPPSSDSEEPSRATETPPPAEDLPDIERIQRLMQARQWPQALRALARLRQQFPESAYAPYLEGHANFEDTRWVDGIDSYRAAIRNNPDYRSDAELIRHVIDCLVSDRFHYRCANFLLSDIGAPAIAHLEEAAQAHQYANVRYRAARLLPKLQPQR